MAKKMTKQQAMDELEKTVNETVLKIREMKDVLRFYARRSRPYQRQPPDPKCMMCMGKGEYETTSHHNGDYYDVTCECTKDPNWEDDMRAYENDAGRKAREILAKYGLTSPVE